MNWREILWLILIGILIALSSFWGVQSCNRSKVIAEQATQLKACLNAPKTVDTAMDSIIVNGKIWLKPKELIKLEITIDTTTLVYRTLWKTIPADTVPPKYCEKYFADSYKVINGKDTGIIYYAIHAKDCESKIIFPKVVFPKEVITITQHVDTCIAKAPEYRAKFLHHGPYVDLTLQNFQQFPGFGLGYQLIFKDQVMLSAGALYMNGLYGNVRIGILFKR